MAHITKQIMTGCFIFPWASFGALSMHQNSNLYGNTISFESDIKIHLWWTLIKSLNQAARADKWYAVVWYHVCPLACLKTMNLCPCLSYFPGFFGHSESLAFFLMGTNLTPKQSNMIFKSIFERYNNKATIFQKSLATLTKNWGQTLTAYTYRMFLQQKNFFTVEKVWHFGLFSGDKGENIDM